ncbi:hypothetical protein PV726_31250 [Streptomyces europaeiscabiei]|uniref:hypothetical protein n=1 Tax=Streptomyces europaeiscabiei TaxID=146819 RepID=UPI0029AD1DED|nr:hypothetical protein [Streptomyces europaeiscabiei]MDX3694731.1 hypothetical protein [Streptomyces europaeiscabiei]
MYSTDVEASAARSRSVHQGRGVLDGKDLEIAAGYHYRGLRAFLKGDGFRALLDDGTADRSAAGE